MIAAALITAHAVEIPRLPTSSEKDDPALRLRALTRSRRWLVMRCPMRIATTALLVMNGFTRQRTCCAQADSSKRHERITRPRFERSHMHEQLSRLAPRDFTSLEENKHVDSRECRACTSRTGSTSSPWPRELVAVELPVTALALELPLQRGATVAKL